MGIARIIAEMTLGLIFEDRLRRALERSDSREAYREELAAIRVIDPSCGEGVFLEAAFDVFFAEYTRAGEDPASAARVIVEKNLFGVDVDADSVEKTRRALSLKAKTSAALQRTILQGNSVVSDPLVDPLAFDWSGRTFDVVLGNPPYVRHELLVGIKEHLSKSYRSYHGMADLFVYFFERGLDLLAPGGRLGFIVANKWLKAGYGAPLRGLLAREARIEAIVDFGHAPIFPDADTFPCIVTLAKAEGDTVQVTRFPREQLASSEVPAYVRQNRYAVPQSRLQDEPWSLEPPEAFALMEKMRTKGTPLSMLAKAHRGVVTGYNEAFIVDTETRDRLVAEDARSAELLKPYLRGQDVDRWMPEWKGQWLIFARQGVDIESYPAVKRHLSRFKDALLRRKPGKYEWYELQDAIDYWRLFSGPKIVYQEIQFHPSYALDTRGMFPSNKVFFLPTSDPWLLAVLNSPLLWWYCWRYLPHMKDETLSPVGERMRALPIAEPSPEARQVAEELVPKLVERKGAEPEVMAMERRLSEIVNEAYGLTAEEVELVYRTAPPRMPVLPQSVGVIEATEIPAYLSRHHHEVPQSRLGTGPWSLEPEAVEALLGKMRERGAPLHTFAGVKPLYGVKTGLNEAFVVDAETRERLVGEDPRSGEILKRFLRGQDLGRWAPEWRGQWLIFARRGIDIDAYPAVKRHLEQWKEALAPRPREAMEGGVRGRRAGKYAWYELQDAVAYWEVFQQPKILWKDLSFSSAFCFDSEGFFTNDLCFSLPSRDMWILAVLNSPLLWWYLSRAVIHGKDEVLRLKKMYMEQVPIAAPSVEARAFAEELVGRLVALRKAGVAGDRKGEEAELERRLSEVVNAAYGLTAEEARLVSETAPPRMPVVGFEEEAPE